MKIAMMGAGGGLVTLGEAMQVPTPSNRAVWDTLAPHAAGRAK